MQRIKINGVEFEVPDGQSVSVVNGVVQIGDSKHQVSRDGLTVEAMGSWFNLDCQGDVVVNGDVQGDVKANNVRANAISGDVEAGGDVSSGPISGDLTAQGSVTCGPVSGDVASQKDVRVSGSVMGDVKCRGNS